MSKAGKGWPEFPENDVPKKTVRNDVVILGRNAWGKSNRNHIKSWTWQKKIFVSGIPSF